MDVLARLALYAAVLVLAVVGGWGVGQLVGPVPSLPSSAADPSADPALIDVHSPARHRHLEHP